jgi:L-asparaginase II
MPVKLVEVIRSGIVESSHQGDAVVVDSDGKIIFEMGNSERLTFFRSSSKPLQAISFLEAGIAEKFNIDLKEIALIMSSHSGEAEHIDMVKGLMSKLGIKEEMFECGVHEPINKEAYRKLLLEGQTPTKLHCNCSGKHLGFMAAAKALGYPVEEYHKSEHIVQQNSEKILLEFCNIEPSNVIRSIDGCGVPVIAVPLRNMALAYANLCDEGFGDGKYAKSQNYVISSMTMYPEMVAGSGRLDTEIMKLFGDRVICKIGAEGVYCAGIIGKAVGIALEIEDGNSRAIGPAIIEILHQMKVLRKDEVIRLKEQWNPQVLNTRGENVGEIKAVFSMRQGIQ